MNQPFSGSGKNFPFLHQCLSQEKFKPKSSKHLQDRKISAKPKLELPLKSPRNENDNGFSQNQKQGLTKMQRIKSFHGVDLGNRRDKDETLLEHYQRQNENLSKQNKFLLEEVRKRKEKQTYLLNCVESLKEELTYFKNISSSQLHHKTPSKTSTETEGSTCYFPQNVVEDESNVETQIQNLNLKFNKLLGQCSGSKVQKEKNKKRKQIAEIACQMKSLRKNIANYE